MPSAKDIRVFPIKAAQANSIVQQLHYSGKTAPNSQLHFGVFLGDKCLGAMQFGPSMVKRTMQPLVYGTAWNGFLELNRMAFSDALPRNSESRALGVALRMMRKAYPHIEWVVSFADGAQCGDGTIYRASGFVLTQIKENTGLLRGPAGDVITRMTTTKNLKAMAANGGRASLTAFKAAGYQPIPGFQLRYLYFLNPAARDRLTCPVLPFSAIDEAGARMYRGQRVGSADSGTGGDQPSRGGAIPTSTLQITAVAPEV